MTTIETSRPLATAPLTPAFATATTGEIELLAYLLERKAEAIAWVAEDPLNRYSSMVNQEFTIEYIRENEWADVSSYKIANLKDAYCDYHKDVYGTKARWVYGMELTEVELEDMFKKLEREHEVVAAAEREREAKNAQFVRERIQVLLKSGAKDIGMAVRWLHEAHNSDGDNKYLDYLLGVDYGFIEGLLQGR
jgi:hypothetical protein